MLETDEARSAEGTRPTDSARSFLGSPIVGQVDLANGLTLVGLMLGLASMAASIAGRFNEAMIALIWAGLADLFDGFVARRMTRPALRATIGRHLDSLVDVSSFGLAPAALVYCSRPIADRVSALAAGAYLCAVVLRLAYFEAVGLDSRENRQYFTGMPVTYAALFLPLAGWGLQQLARYPAWIGACSLVTKPSVLYCDHDALVLTLALLGLAMVSPRRVPKPRGLAYAFFAAAAVALTVAIARSGGVISWFAS